MAIDPKTVEVFLEEARRVLDAQSESNHHLDNKASFILALAGVGLGAALQIEVTTCVVACIQIFAVLFSTAAGVASIFALGLRQFESAPNLKGLETKYLEKSPEDTRKAIFTSIGWAVKENEERVLPGKRSALRWSIYLACVTLVLFAVLGVLKAGGYRGDKTMTSEPKQNSTGGEPKPAPVEIVVPDPDLRQTIEKGVKAGKIQK